MRVFASSNNQCCVPSIALIPFIFITFTITWGLIGLYIFNFEQANAWFGEISGEHPLFYIATWAPAQSAFLVVLTYGGTSGFRNFVVRISLWRCSIIWTLFLLLGIPLIFAAGALVKGNLFSDWFTFDSLGKLAGAMALMLFLGPVEEFGWRGLAQPILQRLMAPIWASLLIGVIWGIWHLPAFYLSGTMQSQWSYTPFLIGNISLAVIVTPLFNASRGSILLPALFHFQLINPLWPDAQPYDTYFFVIVAIAIVWLNRATMFTRFNATTEVIVNSASRQKQ